MSEQDTGCPEHVATHLYTPTGWYTETQSQLAPGWAPLIVCIRPEVSLSDAIIPEVTSS